MNIFISILTFLSMEFVAWFVHKFIMHGLLWVLHKDHHQPHQNKFERNDLFFLVFAIPSIFLMWYSVTANISSYFYIGFGILLYGIAYFVIHEVFIHQRIKFWKYSNHFYFKAIRKAHKIHHKESNKNGAVNFGMLIVSFKYFKEAKKSLI